MFMLRANDRIP